MGRRYKGPVPEEMQDDLGIPGKLYFEKPSVVDISVIRAGKQAMTVDTKSLESPCRLASTRDKYDFIFKDKVHSIKYHAPQRPTANEMNEYLKQAEIHGYGKGTVVARKWCSGWRYRTHIQWGVILDVNRYLMANDTVWTPFSILWLDPQGPNREAAWAEDLFVIHACLSDDLLDSIIEEQM
jgi:hypothetical protein